MHTRGGPHIHHLPSHRPHCATVGCETPPQLQGNPPCKHTAAASLCSSASSAHIQCASVGTTDSSSTWSATQSMASVTALASATRHDSSFFGSSRSGVVCAPSCFALPTLIPAPAQLVVDSGALAVSFLWSAQNGASCATSHSMDKEGMQASAMAVSQRATTPPRRQTIAASTCRLVHSFAPRLLAACCADARTSFMSAPRPRSAPARLLCVSTYANNGVS